MTKQRKNLMVFIGVGMGPVCAIYARAILGLFQITINLSGSDNSFLSEYVMIFIAVGLLIAIVVGMFVAGYLFEKTERWFVRCAILYLAWVLLAIPICALMSILAAGLSERVMDRAEIFAMLISGTPVLLMHAHVVIVPWVIITCIIFRKRFARPRPE